MDADDYELCQGFWDALLIQGTKLEAFEGVHDHRDFMASPWLEKTAALIESNTVT
jgi:hypothetical protein